MPSTYPSARPLRQFHAAVSPARGDTVVQWFLCPVISAPDFSRTLSEHAVAARYPKTGCEFVRVAAGYTAIIGLPSSSSDNQTKPDDSAAIGAPDLASFATSRPSSTLLVSSST